MVFLKQWFWVHLHRAVLWSVEVILAQHCMQSNLPCSYIYWRPALAKKNSPMFTGFPALWCAMHPEVLFFVTWVLGPKHMTCNFEHSPQTDPECCPRCEALTWLEVSNVNTELLLCWCCIVEGTDPAGPLSEGNSEAAPPHHDHDENGSNASGRNTTAVLVGIGLLFYCTI